MSIRTLIATDRSWESTGHVTDLTQMSWEILQTLSEELNEKFIGHSVKVLILVDVLIPTTLVATVFYDWDLCKFVHKPISGSDTVFSLIDKLDHAKAVVDAYVEHRVSLRDIAALKDRAHAKMLKHVEEIQQAQAKISKTEYNANIEWEAKRGISKRQTIK